MGGREGHVRRQGARFELSEDVSGKARDLADIHLVDLSTTGALVELHRFVKPRQELFLHVPLDEETIVVRGSVVHCSALGLERRVGGSEQAVYRAGVQFIDLTETARQLIQDLIIERLQNERREQPRLYVGRQAELQDSVELRAVNLGRQGGLFSVRQPLECSKEYDIVFHVPAGPVRARGVVRHCQVAPHSKGGPTFHVGLQFVRFVEDGEEKVESYLASLETSASRRGAL